MREDNEMMELADDVISAIRTNGRSKRVDDFNVLEIFTKEYNKHPLILGFDDKSGYFHWDILMTNLNEKFPNMIEHYSEELLSIKHKKKYCTHIVLTLKPGIMVDIYGTLGQHLYNDSLSVKDSDKIANQPTILLNEKLSAEDEELIIEIFAKSGIEDSNSISIGMVSYDNGHFYVKEFDIKSKIPELKLLDLHYGEGFEAFDEELYNRLITSKKGLTLFHGDPGSGKTTYLRHLIKRLKTNDIKNNILYFPPTMVGSITEPGFMNFISDWVSDSDGKNYLLIEDAEPLLESRDQSRNIGITNLLNMTDGILNDVLSIQIIATFNTNLSNLDTAILRAERLLARKEFNNLDVESAKILAREIGVDEELIIGKMTLADIYALKKETKPLIHDIKTGKERIGF